MQKAVSFMRFDSPKNKLTDHAKQEAHIKKWAAQKKVDIIRSFETIARPDAAFGSKEWKEMETFVEKNSRTIDFIVTPRFDTLCENNFGAAMGKAEFFQDLGIEMSLASKK